MDIQGYREKAEKVARKIGQWHSEMSIKKQGSFH